jgi:hypothetical protein
VSIHEKKQDKTQTHGAPKMYGRCHLMTIEREADVIVQTVFRNEGKGSLQCPCSHPEVAISLNDNDFKI